MGDYLSSVAVSDDGEGALYESCCESHVLMVARVQFLLSHRLILLPDEVTALRLADEPVPPQETMCWSRPAAGRPAA
jgi:hypothetical protein